MGDHRQATKLWNSLPASAPVLFNRGVAELFAGSAAAAISHFKAAVAQLPDSSSWHHLGRLFDDLMRRIVRLFQQPAGRILIENIRLDHPQLNTNQQDDDARDEVVVAIQFHGAMLPTH